MNFKNNKRIPYPSCPYCQTEMCQVSIKGENTYQCIETPKGKLCGHKEFAE